VFIWLELISEFSTINEKVKNNLALAKNKYISNYYEGIFSYYFSKYLDLLTIPVRNENNKYTED
jgi:hypothetical protein